MATLYSAQYQDAHVDRPQDQIAPPYETSKVIRKYWSYAITAAPTNGDVLKLCKIPKGALLTQFVISHGDLGSAGTLNVGWAASVEVDSSGTALEAASSNGIKASIDVNSNAAVQAMIPIANGAAPAGFMKKFAAEVDVQIDIATAWTVTSGTIQGYIEYAAV